MAFLEATQTISKMMIQRLDDFVSEIDNVHMVWLREIEQEAYRMFSGESSTEPELMPKTPSQKRRPRKKRISLALQEEARTRRRFSTGRRSNLAAYTVKKLDQVFEEVTEPQPATTSVEVAVGEDQPPQGSVVKTEPVEQDTDMNEHRPCRVSSALPKAMVRISAGDRRSAEAARPPQLVAVEPQPSPGRTATNVASPGRTATNVASPDRTATNVASPGRTATNVASPGRTATNVASPGRMDTNVSSPERTATNVAIAGTPTRPRVSLTLRHSAAGLRHSQTRESVRRASRRSLLKKVKAHASNSVGDEDTCAEMEEEDEQQPEKQSEAEEAFADTEQQEQVSASGSSNGVTRASSRSAGSSRSNTDKPVVQSPVRSTRSSKRKAETVLRPNMKTFLQTVHRNQMLMTPNSLGRTAVKSFIKHATPLKVDTVAKERHKLEALKKKQEQEEERMKKIEDEKKKKQEELKRKREERLRKAVEARDKKEQKEEEKKKKMAQKQAQVEEKNDKLRVERLAEEKLKKQLALKHQEEIDSRRKVEEETRLKRLQLAEEEKRQQAKRRAEEEALRAQEVKKERERAERERAEALQREVEKPAREQERKEAEEKELEDQRKKEEQQRLADEERAAQEERAAKQRLAEAAAKMQQPLGQSAGLNMTMDVETSIMKSPTGKDRPAGLNITMDLEKSPQTYSITPKGANKTVKLTGNPDDYGMDQNSDDSTDDESAPRKPIPSWAEGPKLQQALLREYFNPPDLHALFGTIAPPNLEEIFYTKKPRFNKRTSSAVWHSPPMGK